MESYSERCEKYEKKLRQVGFKVENQQVCEQAEPGSCEGYENLIFADVWMHPNPLGHQLAADALEERITGTLPE